MNKYFLKKIRDNMPDFVKHAMAGLIRKKLVGNHDFLNMYNLLMERNKHDKVFVEQYQYKHLKRILTHAYKNVPYYTDLFNQIGFKPDNFKSVSDLSVIPLLTREMINDNHDKLISREEIPGGFYNASTGGSSGKPLKVLHDYKCIFLENAFIYSFRSKLGYRFNDKLATFREVGHKNDICYFNPMYNEYIFSTTKLTPATAKQYLRKINQYQPDYLHGYLSAMYYLAKLLTDQGLKFKKPIKGIFFISETISNAERDFVENFYGAKSFAFYGHTERSAIAPEVAKNRYEFDPYYGYTELPANNDGTQKIISTGFQNLTMPLIRYKTDDACVKTENGYKIYGKWESDAGIYGKNMELLTHAAFTFHSNIFNNVNRSQYVQSERGKATLLIVPNSKFSSEDLQSIQKEIGELTRGIIEFDYKLVDNVILSPAGKLSMFHNTMNENVLVS